jgi:putative hemolysin
MIGVWFDVIRSRRRTGKEMWRASGLIFLAALLISPESAWALANPASVFCAKSGGKSEIRKGARGQYGVCRLPDGRVVDEWAYFRAMRGRSR